MFLKIFEDQEKFFNSILMQIFNILSYDDMYRKYDVSPYSIYLHMFPIYALFEFLKKNNNICLDDFLNKSSPLIKSITKYLLFLYYNGKFLYFNRWSRKDIPIISKDAKFILEYMIKNDFGETIESMTKYSLDLNNAIIKEIEEQQ